MEQSVYRIVNHYRQAWSKETGAAVWVDDVTFNADLHLDVPSAQPSDDAEKSGDEAAKAGDESAKTE